MSKTLQNSTDLGIQNNNFASCVTNLKRNISLYAKKVNYEINAFGTVNVVS